jgi:hypothetical protein
MIAEGLLAVVLAGGSTSPHLGRVRPADRIEISLRRQELVAYQKGRPVLVTHVSTGSGRRYCVKGRCQVARTPSGTFRIIRRYSDWHRSPLGWMYRPSYFYRGWAIHGSMNVPEHPASHGCVRVPMDVIDRLARMMRLGERVYIRR